MGRSKLLQCPGQDCAGTLEKPPKYAEGAWRCSECGEDWLVMHIPHPKVSYGTGGDKKRKVQDAPKKPSSFTKKEAKEAVTKVTNKHP